MIRADLSQSESERLPVEKTRWETQSFSFAGMKAGGDNLTESSPSTLHSQSPMMSSGGQASTLCGFHSISHWNCPSVSYCNNLPQIYIMSSNFSLQSQVSGKKTILFFNNPKAKDGRKIKHWFRGLQSNTFTRKTLDSVRSTGEKWNLEDN